MPDFSKSDFEISAQISELYLGNGSLIGKAEWKADRQMMFCLIPKHISGAIVLLCLCWLGFSGPCFGDTRSDWLEWKEKGRREQAALSYHMAEDYYLRSILEASKIGPNSIELLESKERLAACLVSQKKFYEAEPYYRDLCASIEQLQKKKAIDAESLVWLEELAEAYAAVGMETPGRKRYGLEHALVLRDLISGDEHPEISFTLKALGKLYVEQGNNKEAEKLITRLVRVDQRFLGPESAVLSDDLCGLGIIESELSEWDKSESYFRQSLAILFKNDPTHRTFMLFNVRVMMARAVLKKDEAALSEKEATAALADFEKGDGKGKNEFMTAYGRHIIAACKVQEKRYDEALRLYAKNQEILEPVFGKNDRRMILHWRRVQRVYKAMNAPEKINEIEVKIKGIEAASRLRAAPGTRQKHDSPQAKQVDD